MKNNKKTMKTIVFSLGLAAMMLTANNLNAQNNGNRGLFGMGKSSADYDYNYNSRGLLDGEGIPAGSFTNADFGEQAPLGSGIAILLAAGAGYAVVRRKRSRRNTTLLLACVMLLGFTQCKKDQPEPQNEQVRITLNVDSGASTGSTTEGSRANVNPTGSPMVTFENGDQILVVSNGKYVGAMTCNGTNFVGDFDGTHLVEGQPLYFYFLGNKINVSTLTPGSSDRCTVNISDQSEKLPVISMGKSNVNYSSSVESYSSRLYNKASLMKFNVTTDSDAAICITGMNNKVTVDFGKIDETGTGLGTDDTNNGFSYSMDETDGGLIKMVGGAGSPAVKWAIVLPQATVAEGDAYTADGAYTGTRPAIEGGIAVNTLIDGNFAFEVATAAVRTVNLSEVTSDTTLVDGDILKGTLNGANNADHRVKISIADGATITLSDAQILGCLSEDYYKWAGLNCLGDATIIIDDGTTNVVQGSNYAYPGINIPANKTLTINANGSGTGTLDARCISTGAGGAGIGAIDNTYGSGTCGNIVINGGVITATGAPGISSGSNSGLPGGAGIGGAPNTSCGTITINGGTVNATGGIFAAGIGTSSGTQDGGDYYSNCGAITITGGDVTAQGGLYAAGIGAGYNKCSNSTCNCESVTITGGTVTATGGGTDEKLFGAGIGSGYASITTAKSTCGNISISTSETVTATGGKYAAGIGSGYVYGKQKQPTSSCGNIEITAGTVIATGGQNGAGIGTGYKQIMGTCSCGTITIGTGVTQVTAEKGSGATNSIGVGKSGTCGTVTIGGVVGAISDSPYTYQP